MMKTLATLAAVLASSAALAAPAKSSKKPTGATFTGVDEVCGERIAKRVLKEALKRYGKDPITAETISIRSVVALESLNKDMTFLRAFRVQESDEVGSSSWLVITDNEDCVIEFVNVADEE